MKAVVWDFNELKKGDGQWPGYSGSGVNKKMPWPTPGYFPIEEAQYCAYVAHQEKIQNQYIALFAIVLICFSVNYYFGFIWRPKP